MTVGETPTPRTAQKPKNHALEYVFWLKKEGYRESTIRRYGKIILLLSKRADIIDAESVKEFIADSGWNEGTKALACDAYRLYAKMKGFRFEKPIYKRVDSLPFIPMGEELDMLISGSGKRMSAFLQILKDIGARSGEIWGLKWTDIDFANSVVYIRPEKGSEARVAKLSGKAMTLLNGVPRKSERVFTGNLDHFRRNYELKRKYLAGKFGNPRLLGITFHTFRHWKATTEYHRTKDLLYVKKLLGHRSLTNTLRYTHLVDFQSDDYVCKVARTVEEAKPLVESGFEYVTEMEGVTLFRKYK
jgi:integrase